MNDPTCDRWATLSDALALGEALAADDTRFLREHAARCPVCAAEAHVWDTLGSYLAESADAPRASAPAAPAPAASTRWSWGRRAALLAAAVALVAVALWFAPFSAEAPGPSAAAPSDARVNIVLVAGDVRVGGTQAAAGAALRQTDTLEVGRGRACLSYAWGTTACASRDTKLRLLAAEREHRELALDSGTVVCRLDAQPAGVRFSVETARGRITARGTVFAVERRANGAVSVRLHRGSVEVESLRGARVTLTAPAAVVLDDEVRPAAPAGAAWDEDTRVVEAAALWAEGAIAPLDITSEPPGARVTLDGLALGESPVSALVGRGEHAIVVERAGFAPYRERLVVQGAERVSRAPALVAAASPSAASALPTAVAGPTAAELLARARAHRGSGRYADAAVAYQSLIAGYPGSAEARAALVSLGELQLSQLGNPGAALRSFDAYLGGGGALVQEARYGRIRALRQLGRAAEAQRATDEFLRAYPGSAQAQSLRERAR